MLEGPKSQPDISFHISKGVEIKVGHTVPVLQHWHCAGTQGTVVVINPKSEIYQINCNKCGKSVTLDTRTLTKPTS